MTNNLKDMLIQGLTKVSQEKQAAQQNARKFADAYQSLVAELREFTSGAPVQIAASNMTWDVYGSSIPMTPLNFFADNAAQFALQPQIQTGGAAPSATSFKLMVTATRIAESFPRVIYFNPTNSTWTSKDPGTLSGLIGQFNIDPEQFKRALVYALTGQQ